MKEAYGYLRVSSQGQVDGHGLQRQREAIEQYAAANGYSVQEVFTDEGVSGTLDDRPGLGSLMHRIEVNGVCVVIIEKLDRLARDLVVQEHIIADMHRHGVKLISVAEGPDLASDDPSRKMIRQIMGAVAEYDKNMIVLKLRAARAAKRAKQGKCEGAKGYGETDPTEAAAIKRVKQLRRKRKGRAHRMSPRKIAEVMNIEGHPTRFGGPWTADTIKGILYPRKRRAAA